MRTAEATLPAASRPGQGPVIGEAMLDQEPLGIVDLGATRDHR
jgi:hypothetical protein